MKSEREREFQALLDEYSKRFGKNYPLGWGCSGSDEEIETEIKNALRTGKPVPEPEYDEENDY